MLSKYILYYRENKEQEDLNKALELFKSIDPKHEGIDKEDYNIVICALATEFAQLDRVENLKTSLELYNIISKDTTGIKIKNLNMLRRLLCFNLCMSYEDVKENIENVDTIIDNLYNQILENSQGINGDTMDNIADAYYMFKSKQDSKQHFLIEKVKIKN